MTLKTFNRAFAAIMLAVSLSAGDGDDGPYVYWSGAKSKLVKATGGQLESKITKGHLTLNLEGLSAKPLRLDPDPPKPAQDLFPQPAKILAISDIHGHKDAMIAFLQHQGVVDQALRWTFGQGHLVIVGDLFDRGDQVTECLWFLHALERPAQAAGGQVHVLLGNHEFMVLQGDLRYLHPKYPKLCAEVFKADLPSLFGAKTELGRWLRSRAVVLRLGTFLFVHGGLDPASYPGVLDQRIMNSSLRQGLDMPREQRERNPLFGPRGPLWYRGLVPGYQSDAQASTEAVAGFLNRNGLNAMVIGHTTLEQVTSLHDGKVIAVDAGFKDGRPGEGWLWSAGKMWRALADGTTVPLTAP